VPIIFRIAALVLLANIAIDVQDAACDPLPNMGDSMLSSRSPGSTADPCSDSCVPDCFCCSNSLAAVPAFGSERPGPIPEVPDSSITGPIQGTPLVQDHVPKPLL
jgi:hypothetical protein